ncbi:unnamed protein product, partial [Taenia asiatica]|uniref:Kazal-like domain-containing protein n=1 Tax=Taenia asiatica TaxID=60517 RepID=A0A0R3WCP1_TAEAS
MAYLCKLNTPLRKTEHLNADGNCVRAKRSIVEIGDLNTLNNCITSCPMIAEHCTYKQQHQHRGCTVNPDECRSLRDVRSAMAHSRKVRETAANSQLNTSMTRSKICSQVCQSPVDSSKSLFPLPAQRYQPNISSPFPATYRLIFAMPVGCFPSFRRKIKKFNKGKAPLSKKEESRNDVSHKNLKPTEENNHAEEKAETSIKVEQQSGLAQQRQEGENKAQKTIKKTFEQVAEVHHSAECAANELVTSSEPTEHIKEIDESHTCETASPGAIMMEHEDARETVTTSEIETFCEASPKTELVKGHMGVRGLAIPQEAEPPYDAPPAEVTVKHEEELQSDSAPPTEEM